MRLPKLSTPVLLKLAAVVVPLSLLLAAWASLAAWQAQRDLKEEIAARQVASCEAGNETREILRGMGYDVGVTSGVTGGEALITVAEQSGDGTDPETIEAYRQALTAQLDPALTDIVNRLPARRWDPERGECVDVPLEDGP
jgi:hypothetical protein